MIRYILFDLDGVLVDAVKLHQQAFLEAVTLFRYVSEEEHMRELNALPTKKKLEKLGVPDSLREEIYNKKQEITLRLIPKFILPVKKVIGTINEIKKRNIRFAVCSNSIRKSTELLLRYGGVDGFDFFLSNQDVINPKPNPEIYIKAMEKLGCQKSEVLIVEDSPIGVKAGVDSGANVLQINNPFKINKVLEVLDEYNNPSSWER